MLIPIYLGWVLTLEDNEWRIRSRIRETSWMGLQKIQYFLYKESIGFLFVDSKLNLNQHYNNMVLLWQNFKTKYHSATVFIGKYLFRHPFEGKQYIFGDELNFVPNCNELARKNKILSQKMGYPFFPNAPNIGSNTLQILGEETTFRILFAMNPFDILLLKTMAYLRQVYFIFPVFSKLGFEHKGDVC